MDKEINKILEYVNENVNIKLTTQFKGCINSKQFLEYYNMHDRASSDIALKYFKESFSLHPIGKDLRNTQAIIQNTIPDYFTEKLEQNKKPICFCFDVKSKSKTKYFGWINAYKVFAYRKFYKFCKIPVFLIFTLIENNKFTNIVGFCNINDKPKEITVSWDGYKLYIFNWKLGLPFID